jgi:two-component system OmpR family response regulator
VARILVADDDGHIREVVRYALEQAGHTVVEAADGIGARAAIEREALDLAVLDIVMPGPDGLELCRRAQARDGPPILFLTSREGELDRVLGLELGADDYLTKPFSPRELVARVKAVLRRTAPREETPPAAVLRHCGLELDAERHRCHFEGREVSLTATEFTLLGALMGRPGKVYGRDELVELAYGCEHHITWRTVDSHVRRIRAKLAEAGASEPIETVHGVGYRMRE